MSLRGITMEMRSSNPALNSKSFENLPGVARTDAMTLQGTVNKTGILLVCVLITAAWTWNQVRSGEQAGSAVMIGAIGGFVMGMVTVFKRNWAPFTSPVYALLEGIVIGGLSALMESQFPGIAMQAALLTMGTLFCMLLAYTSGVIRVTDNFRLGVAAATGGIALVYFVSMILGFFGIAIPYIHSSGLVGIAFSLLVVGIAALNLVMDFDFIDSAARQGAPKYMEWY